ncbi:hypothetical protein MHBO_004237, partial [Bonamia ostreae]
WDDHKFVYFSKNVLDCSLNVKLSFLTKLEDKLEKFSLDKNKKTLYLDCQNGMKRIIIHNLAKNYGLKTETLDNFYKSSVQISKETSTFVPVTKLSDAIDDYKENKFILESVGWPIGCTLHGRNNSKSEKTIKLVKEELSENELNIKMKIFKNTSEEMDENKRNLNAKFFSIKFAPAT